MIVQLDPKVKAKWIAKMAETEPGGTEETPAMPVYRRTEKQLHIRGSNSYCPLGMFLLAIAPKRIGSGMVNDVFIKNGITSDAQRAIVAFNEKVPITDYGWTKVIPWVEANF